MNEFWTAFVVSFVATCGLTALTWFAESLRRR